MIKIEEIYQTRGDIILARAVIQSIQEREEAGYMRVACDVKTATRGALPDPGAGNAPRGLRRVVETLHKKRVIFYDKDRGLSPETQLKLNPEYKIKS